MVSTERSLQEFDDLESFHDRPDAELWSQWKRGEETAFRELLRRYSDLVWSVCRRILFREQDSEDAFQITFLTLFRRGDQINKEVFGPWLRRVAFHAALQIRDHRIQTGLGEDYDMDQLADTSDAFEDIEKVERNLTIEQALDLLPEYLYEPLVQFHFEGRSRFEIAENCNISESQVKSRLQQARKKLREHLAKKGLGVGVLVAVLGAPEFAKATTPSILVEKTLANVKTVNSQQGISTFLEQTSILERKLFMSTHSLGLVKGAAIAIVTAIAVTLLSVILNPTRPTNASVQDTTIGSNTQASRQTKQQVSTFTTTTKPAANNQRVSTHTMTAPNNLKNSVTHISNQSSDDDKIAGSWVKGDMKIEINPSTKVFKISTTRLAGLPYNANVACEYRRIGDMLVGVILNCNIELIANLPQAAEGKYGMVDMNGMLTAFSDQPFMIRLKANDSSLYIRDVRFSIPLQLLSNDFDPKNSLQIKGFLVGEFKKEK